MDDGQRRTKTWSETFANTFNFNEFFIIKLEKPSVNHVELCKCPYKEYQHIRIFRDNGHICVLYYGLKNQAGISLLMVTYMHKSYLSLLNFVCFFFFYHYERVPETFSSIFTLQKFRHLLDKTILVFTIVKKFAPPNTLLHMLVKDLKRNFYA